MVYNGKPSRGCLTCRARRIKCDEGKPTCKRCEKSGRECAGYRPDFDIVHRDQTKSTTRRLRMTEAADTSQASGSGSSSHSSRFVFVSVQQPQRAHVHSSGKLRLPGPIRDSTCPSPSPAMPIPVTHRAACHFASNFVLLPLAATDHGFMEYLAPLVGSEPHDSALRHAFNACAFSLLNNRAKADSVDLAKMALKEHTLALGKTHSALRHPPTAKTDAALVAVLLLSMYEYITGFKEPHMLAWRSHIDGAVQIVRDRGRAEMCSTKTGTLLFNAVRNRLISRSLSAGMPLPFGVDWWTSRGGGTRSLAEAAEHFSLRTAQLFGDTSHLLEKTNTHTPEGIASVLEMWKRVNAMDQEIADWLVAIPAEYRAKTLCWIADGPPHALTPLDQLEAFPGSRVDVYPDFVTARAHNSAHVSRLLLAALSIRLAAWLCSPADYRLTPEYQAARVISEAAIADIIASVPYHLGWHTRRGDLFRNVPDMSTFACGRDEPFKALPAMFILWPITTVKNYDMTTDRQRVWAKGRLQFIEDQVGLKYAALVNKFELRFPSMMIRSGGLAAVPGPLEKKGIQGLPLRP
ncbi:hypothetical protein B0H63DRAFT_141793 [Podospora didyma]|uniref:Zn(2)-C6 fungal-type domain-containing protein n=1 Tax=Podospora didyma TaxID=330526 RepID=A0AAE0NSW3_9PEZI|nr:hypothetical protein B0H63DRAFT_141793 [Podospora didyma]